MKELTIEQKAQRYDEAIGRANSLLSDNQLGNAWIYKLLPELAESEDEKIIEWIKEGLEFYANAIQDKQGLSRAIAWLEKQREKKSISKIPVSEKLYEHIRNICACIDDAMSSESIFDVKDYIEQASKDAQDAFDMLENQSEQRPTEEYNITGIGSKNAQGKLGEMIKNLKSVNEVLEQQPTDKVEPKFHKGQWITDGYFHCKISDVLEDRYIVDTKFVKRSAILFNDESRYHLWTIEDVNVGDILAAEVIDGKYSSPFIAIYKERGLDFFNSYCFVTLNGEFVDEGDTGHDIKDIHPATKEQRDFLFQKMHDAGYEWDAEKKELKKIEQKPVEPQQDMLSQKQYAKQYAKFVDECIYGEQKPVDNDIKEALHMEYEKGRADAIAEMQNTWSEEDKGNLLHVKCIIDEIGHNQDVREKIEHSCEELDSLWHWLDNIWQRVKYPQTIWKPSDAQIASLTIACDRNDRIGFDLTQLLRDLKKLKG